MRIDEMQSFTKMIEHLFEGIYVVDLHRRIVFWNKGAELIAGFTSEEMTGRTCSDNLLNHIDDSGCQLCLHGCPLHATIQDGVQREAAVYLHHKSGHRVNVTVRTIPLYDDDHIVGSIEVFRGNLSQNSMFKQIEGLDLYADKSEEQLKLLALYDQLTRLPNRRYMENLIEMRLFEYTTLGIPFGVLFIDVDDFHQVNNAYGHATGDETLRVVASTFINAVRSSDVIGRWGGDEFLGIFPVPGLEDLHHIAVKIRVLIEQSRLRRPDGEIAATVSIGGTMVRPKDTRQSLIARADQLMYQSKSAGKNRISTGG